MRCQEKALIHPSPGEVEPSAFAEICSEAFCMRQPGCSSLTSVPTDMCVMDLQSLTCVLSAYGLRYLSPVHTVFLVYGKPSSGATPKVRKRHRRINRGSEKAGDRSVWVRLKRRGGDVVRN